MAGTGEDSRGDRRAVVTGDVGDRSVAPVVRQHPRGDRLDRLRHLVLGVEAVAEHGPGETTLDEGLLGRMVTGATAAGFGGSGSRPDV